MRTSVSRDERHELPRWAWLVVWVCIGAAVAILAAIALDRPVYNYNTETDYLGGFVPEASRLLRGEPLEIAFHPPLYAVAIAFAHSLARDWFVAGLLVSLASSLGVLAFSVELFRRILGPGAALGAAVALGISPTFLHFSMQATSEIFSLAVYMAAVLVAWWSAERKTLPALLLAGVVIGVALLARTNHIVLLGLLLFYLVPVADGEHAPRKSRPFRALATVALAFSLPLAAWAGFAASTGAPIVPTKNHENLALTYFGEDDRISGDVRLALAREFTSTLDVLVEDPARIAKIYVRDLVVTTYRLLTRDTVLPFPLVALGLLFWLAIVAREGSRRLALSVLLLNIVAMVLLLNFKAYEHRYYVFLVPFVGAAVGHVVSAALRRRYRDLISLTVALGSVALVAYGAVTAFQETRRLHGEDWSRDAFAAAQALDAVDASSESLVYARKPHVAHYAGVASEILPPLDDLDALIGAMAEAGEEAGAPVFLFYGAPERSARPQFSSLSVSREVEATRLQLVSEGDEGDGWTLYTLDRPGSPNSVISPGAE